MGNAIQRLQILLVGLLLLLAAAVAVIVVFMRPESSGLLQVTPVPVATAASQATPIVATVIPTTIATVAAPTAQSVAAAPAMPAAPALTFAEVAAISYQFAMLVWPFALLAVGVVGVALVARRIFRRRRMAYTGQSVGMLLDAADTTTRATNLQAMRDLQQRGELPQALAEAAGLAPRRRFRLPTLRFPTLPRLMLPKVALPRLRLPKVALPKVRRAPTTVQLAFTPLPELPTNASGQTVLEEPIPTATEEPSADDLPAVEAAQPNVIADVWSAEDRALAAAAALAAFWRSHTLTSPILALETPERAGAAAVTVTIDPAPVEEETLETLTDALEADHAGWRARWGDGQRGQARLIIDGCATGAPPSGGPLLAPILRHGRGGDMLHYHPLTHLPHLGLYGAGALTALHTILASLLYTQSPRGLALLILDTGQITPLYRATPHLLPPPADAEGVIYSIVRNLRRSASGMRPLLLVVVEPSVRLLTALAELVSRARALTAAPLYLIITQERIPANRSAGEVYARLAALMTAGGSGDATFLPGQGDWPATGAARYGARGLRREGRPLAMNETAIAAALAPLRATVSDLPPTVLDEVAVPESITTPIADSRYTIADAAQPDAPEHPIAPAESAIAETVSPDDLPQPTLANPIPTPIVGTESQLREGTKNHTVHTEPTTADLSAIGSWLSAMDWPDGPGGMDGAAVAALCMALCEAPAITAGTRPGVSRGRLRPLLAAEHHAFAADVMTWLDTAGVLVEPHRDDLRWREPRPLVSTDLVWIAQRLAVTPLPVDDAVESR